MSRREAKEAIRSYPVKWPAIFNKVDSPYFLRQRLAPSAIHNFFEETFNQTHPDNKKYKPGNGETVHIKSSGFEALLVHAERTVMVESPTLRAIGGIEDPKRKGRERLRYIGSHTYDMEWYKLDVIKDRINESAPVSWVVVETINNGTVAYSLLYASKPHQRYSPYARTVTENGKKRFGQHSLVEMADYLEFKGKFHPVEKILAKIGLVIASATLESAPFEVIPYLRDPR